MWCCFGEGSLAQGSEVFASLKQSVLPSCTELSKSHITGAAAGQRGGCQEAFSEQSFFSHGHAVRWEQSMGNYGFEWITEWVLWVGHIFGWSFIFDVLRLWRKLRPMCAFTSLCGNLQLFWSLLSSLWGSEVGINCTSKRLPPPSWCLLRSQAAVFVLTLKFTPQSERLLLRVFPSAKHWHIRTGLWAIYTVALLWLFLCSNIHFGQSYTEL